jgi:hypothetical protein
MQRFIKNRIFLLSLFVSLAFMALTVYLRWEMKQRSQLIKNLSSYNNVIISYSPPTWVTYLPNFLVKPLQESFPINIDINSESSVNLFADDSKEASIVSFELLTQKLAMIDKLQSLTITLPIDQNSDSLLYIDALLSLKNLQSLDITADRLSLIKKIPPSANLKHLSIHANAISASLVQSLTHCQNLESLSLISGTPLREAHLQGIGQLKKINKLILNDLQCAPQTLSSIFKLPQLTYLDLGTPTRSLLQQRQQQNINKYFDLSQHVEFITNAPKLETLNANILLTEDNLKKLSRLPQIPRAYYDLPKSINDEYLIHFEIFLSKISNKDPYFRQGLIDKVIIGGQKAITQKSKNFLQKFSPKSIDFKGTSFSGIDQISFENVSEIYFSKEVFTSNVINQLTNPEYNILDFSNTQFNDDDLKLLLQKTKVRTLLLHNTKISEDAIDTLMTLYKKHQKDKLKVSFGSWDIPPLKKNKFLERVHQWGMLSVYSSHLDPAINFPTWASHTSKYVIHDRPGFLINLELYFPQVRTLNLRGNKLSLLEWRGLKKLSRLSSLSLNSKQNGAAIGLSGILQNLNFLEINSPPESPIEIGPHLETCQVFLDKGHSLKDVLSFKKGSPKKIHVSGYGKLDLSMFQDVSSLEELSIGPNIKITNIFPKITNLAMLTCRSPLSSSALTSIGNLPALENFNGNCQNLSGENIRSWRHCQQLISLDLSSANLGDNDLDELKNLKALEALKLPATERVTITLLPLLKDLANLKKLGINGTAIPSKAISDQYENLPLWSL